MTISAALELDFVIHVGAGTGADVEEYFKEQIDQIILIEADPLLAKVLETRFFDCPQVEIMELAVVEKTQGAVFYRSNYSDLSSVKLPSASVSEIFPNLSCEKVRDVEFIEIDNLLQMLCEKVSGSGMLVIETFGFVEEIIAKFSSSDLLNHVSIVRYQIPATVLHEYQIPSDDIGRYLESCGFIVLPDADASDPEFPHFWGFKSKAYLTALASLKAIEGEKRGIRDELSELQKRYNDVLEQKSKLEESTRLKEAKYKEAEAMGERLKDELKTLRLSADEVERTLDQKKQEVHFLTLERDGLRRDSEVDKLNLDSLKEEHHNFRSESENKEKELLRKIDALREEMRCRVSESEKHASGASKKISELEMRLKRGQENLRRAEGQIELIKDLLLRGEAF